MATAVVAKTKTPRKLGPKTQKPRPLEFLYSTLSCYDETFLFAKAKILPVTFLYYAAISKLMFDVHNQSAPINILKLFTKTSHIHTYNT